MSSVRRRPERDTVLFLSCWPLMGGAQISLAIAMEALHPRVRTVLVAPPRGPLVDRLEQRGGVDEHVHIPLLPETTQFGMRLGAAVALLRWLWRNHRRLAAVHANGDAELKLLLPVLPVIWRPIVVWYHRREVSPSTRKLGVVWRLLGRRLRWATVSDAAKAQLADVGVNPRNVSVLPNPIHVRDVVPNHRRAPDGKYVFGYLGCENEAKGILLLPDIADAVGNGIQILCITKGWPPERNAPSINTALDRLREDDNVAFGLRDFDVRNIYARIDALLVPSLSESFCRIAAEAMLAGLPVVASDLPSVREVTGDGAAALLFPIGDVSAATERMRRLAADPYLRETLVENGQQLAQRYNPGRIADGLGAMYGLTR